MTSLIQRVIYPFFSNTIKLRKCSSTSNFDSSASSTTTESFLWVPKSFYPFESNLTDTECSLQFTNNSDKDKETFEFDAQSCEFNGGASSWNRCGYNSCEADDTEPIQEKEPEEWRQFSRIWRNKTNHRSLKRSKNLTPSFIHNKDYKQYSKVEFSTSAESNGQDTQNSFFSDNILSSTSTIKSNNLASSFSATDFHQNRNREMMYGSLRRSNEPKPEKLMSLMKSKFSDTVYPCNAVSSKLRKGKVTLGKCKIKCLRNDVKKDILGFKSKFLDSQIDSDSSIIRSVDFESDFKFSVEKRHLNETEMNSRSKSQLATLQSGVENKRLEVEESCLKPNSSLMNSYFDNLKEIHHSTKMSAQIGASRAARPSRGKNRVVGIVEPRLNIIQEEPSQLKTISESSISTTIIKRNLDQINKITPSGPLPCIKNLKIGRKISTGGKIQTYPCFYESMKESNRLNESKSNDVKVKSDAEELKRRTELIKDTFNGTPHRCDKCSQEKQTIKKSTERDNKVKKETDMKRNIRCQNNTQGFKTNRSPEAGSVRTRTFCNTLHVQNQYLELKTRPAKTRINDMHIRHESKDFPLGLSSSIGITMPSLETNETSSQQNRTLLMKKINTLISPLKNGNDRDKSNEKKQSSLLKCRLVESIILQNQNGVEVGRENKNNGKTSEDIFKSHCDVYYTNKARNFKRKKCLGMLDKERKRTSRDDVFNDTNCRTVYVNMARKFDKNILDMNIK